MAFSVGGSSSPNGSVFGNKRFRGNTQLAEINIIPLVDVVLVLLIIFMLTAHVMEFGMEVEVPKVDTTQDTAKELPVITISRDGDSFLNEKRVNIHDIGRAVKSRFQNANSVYLRADRQANWDQVAQVIAACSQAKLAVNVVTQPEDHAARRR
ncbi:MAG TPA: biopolymer transporter ExbD [Verrucomicrobiae bacterium]|nr:biopolymer transporter ExbD [Verrucomicrobiae bacterium]